jgi:hypothetical protein
MIKTILVPATGSDTDSGVFASALAVARPFGAHIDFLHVRIDAATFAATIMPEVSSAQVVTDLINRMKRKPNSARKRQNSCSKAFVSARDWRSRKPRPGHRRPRQGGSGKSGLNLTGSWNTHVRPTS